MGTKITALPQVATPTGSDELPISQDTGSGRTTYKTTLDQLKNYIKNTGGGTGTVTSVGVNSNDGSIGVIGSPVVGAGTISLSISSVGLNKLDDGGAIGGQVLTYDGSTSTWVASAVTGNVNTLNFIEKPASASNGQVLTYNGSTSTWVASAVSQKIEKLTYNNLLYPNITNNITHISLVEAGTLPTLSAISAANSNVYAVGMYKSLSAGTWTVPAAVKKIRVFCVGGSGGNGSTSSCTEGSNGGGGGGGGGLSIRDITLTTGNTYTVTNGTNGGIGVGGTSSSFSGNGVTMTGSGGAAGINGDGGGCYSGAGGGAGGSGGSASGGQVNATGTTGTRGGTQDGVTGTPGSIPNLGINEIGVGVTILILELNDVVQTVSF